MVFGVFALEKDTIFGFEKIYKAYEECRKGERNTTNVLKFEKNLEENLLELHSSLNNKSYEPRRSVCFIVLKPKPREIFAADFRDRIVHHIIVGALEGIFEPIFSENSFACRKNKGTHKAVRHLQRNMRKITGSNNERKSITAILKQRVNTQSPADEQIKIVKKQKLKQCAVCDGGEICLNYIIE